MANANTTFIVDYYKFLDIPIEQTNTLNVDIGDAAFLCMINEEAGTQLEMITALDAICETAEQMKQWEV